MLFFGKKIPTTEQEIMLHAMSLNLPILLHILTAWDELDQRIIDMAVRQWSTRLRVCIKVKGGQLRNSLKNNLYFVIVDVSATAVAFFGTI